MKPQPKINSTDFVRERVHHIDIFGKNLSEWEIGFISNLIDHPPKTFSDKQVKIINRIYDWKC